MPNLPPDDPSSLKATTDTPAVPDSRHENRADTVVETVKDSFNQGVASVLANAKQPEANTDVRRPKHFNAVLEKWRNEPDGFQYGNSWTENGQRKNAIIQFKNIVGGSDTDGIHRRFYRDWSIDDFVALLRELGEEVPRPPEFWTMVDELKEEDEYTRARVRRSIRDNDAKYIERKFPGWSKEDLEALLDELRDDNEARNPSAEEDVGSYDSGSEEE